MPGPLMRYTYCQSHLGDFEGEISAQLVLLEAAMMMPVVLNYG